MDSMENVLSLQTYAEDTKNNFNSQDCQSVGDTASCVTNRCATVGATSSCETTGCEYRTGSVVGTGVDPDFAGY